jgi:hypothetical protein
VGGDVDQWQIGQILYGGFQNPSQKVKPVTKSQTRHKKSNPSQKVLTSAPYFFIVSPTTLERAYGTGFYWGST